jgi:endo-1,4-beta-xylanase
MGTQAPQAEEGPDSKIDGHHSLKAHARKRGLLAGCAVGAAELRDDTYRKILAEQYDIVVAENAMKFGSIQPKPDTWFWDDADALVAFAQEHKMKVRGHNFAWHENIPAWFAGTVTKDNARKVLTDHILTEAGRYKGKIHSWDVVNEAINLDDGRPDGLRKCPWLDLIGPDYLELAYKTARQADPNAKLTYNEYGIENDHEDNDKKRAATLDLIKRLKAAGAPVDALGIQSHIAAAEWARYGKGLQDLIEAARNMGLEVYVTELDVNDDDQPNNDIAARDQLIAQTYQKYLTTVLQNQAVKAVLTWGLTDKHTWLNDGKTHQKKQPNRRQRPLPFDDDYKPTPAYFAMRDCFDKAPHR